MAAANNKANEKLNFKVASVSVNVIIIYIISAPELGMPSAPYFIKQEVTKFLA